MFEIKTTLLDLFTDSADRAFPNYQSFVSKSILKCENILKLLLMPNEEFSTNFSLFLGDASANDLEKMSQMKGIRKQELSHLFKQLFM